LSRGARTKVLLSAALSRRPQLLVLDEPSDGLDPGAVEDLWSMLMERVGTHEGAGMILSTNRIDDAERVCDHVIVLDRGRLILEGETDDLRSGWRRLILRPPGSTETIDALPGVVACRSRNGVVEATTSEWDPSFSERLPAGVELLESNAMSVREIYLTVIGHDR
jgi:ABC-type multidrug transport system ATPase subunit